MVVRQLKSGDPNKPVRASLCWLFAGFVLHMHKGSALWSASVGAHAVRDGMPEYRPRHASSEWLQVYNTEVVMGIRAALLKSGMTQNPCLECADAEVDDTFIC
jgi:hypothetical protein